jgi:hypothetical protein
MRRRRLTLVSTVVFAALAGVKQFDEAARFSYALAKLAGSAAPTPTTTTR